MRRGWVRGKRIFLSFSILLAAWMFGEGAFGQTPDTLWTRTFGGTNIDVAYGVRQTRDGGYVVAGYTRSFGTVSGRNVLLIKTDQSGDEEWLRTFGGNDDEEGYSVQQTIDGGYIIAGYTKSWGAGSNDVLLIKTDTSGNAEWTQTFGGTQAEEAYSVWQTYDGGYIVAGATSSYGAGSRDVWLIKTTSSGTESWRKTLGGFGSDGARSVEQVSDGGYVVTGWTYSYGPGAVGNVWLVKTDTSGNMAWNRFFGGTDVDRGYCVQQTTDRGYIVTGYTSSFGSGLDDMVLIKTDSAGNESWTRTFGGSGRDYGNCVRQTADGGYIIAGYTLSFGAGGDDVWLVRTDANGNQTWTGTYGGSASDVAYSLDRTSDGGYIVAGHTLSYGAGVHDVWLVRIAPDPTDVDEGDPLPQGYRLAQNYPNPFNPTTSIKFTVPTPSNVRIVVYDLLGREVRTLVDGHQDVGRGLTVWDGRDNAGTVVTSGLYLCRMMTDGFAQSIRVVFLK